MDYDKLREALTEVGRTFEEGADEFSSDGMLCSGICDALRNFNDDYGDWCNRLFDGECTCDIFWWLPPSFSTRNWGRNPYWDRRHDYIRATFCYLLAAMSNDDLKALEG